MQLKKICWSLLVVIMLLSTIAFSAFAAEDTFQFTVATDATVSEAGELVVNKGDIVTVEVGVSNNPGANNINFTLAFDENVLEPVVEDGELSFETAIYTFYDDGESLVKYSEGTGEINVGSVKDITLNDKTDTGVVFTVKFLVKETGACNISVTNTLVYKKGSRPAIPSAGATFEAVTHNFPAKGEVVAPTCTEDGYTRYYCQGCAIENCNYYYDEVDEGSALGHTNDPHAAQAPGCETIGWDAYVTCSRCDYTTYNELPALGHNEFKLDAIEANCITEGKTEGIICTVCNEILSGYETVPAKGHVYATDAWEVVVEPTCNSKGYQQQICPDCDCIVDSATIPESDKHSVVEIKAVAATCTTAGATKGTMCSICNEVLEAPEEIKATGHQNLETITGKDATCTSIGITDGKVCKDCGTITVGQAEIAIKWHNFKFVSAVAADCVTAGIEGHFECVDCGIISATMNAPIVAPTVIDALGHNKITTIDAVSATCTSIGLTEGKKCSRCGIITVEQEIVNALGHTEIEIPAVDATCTSTGLEAGKRCSVCNVITVEQKVVAAKGHNTEIEIPAVDATCTATGLEAGKRCSVCNVITVEQKVVAAKGHTEEAIPAVDATCTAAGSTAGVKCSVCTVVLEAPEVVQPKGHTNVEIPAVEATYSEDGSTEGKQCSTCNTITDATGVIPAKSLAWLWVLIGGVIVVGGLVAVYFFVLRKKD